MPSLPRERAIASAILLTTLTAVAGLSASGVTQMIAADLFPLATTPAAAGTGKGSLSASVSDRESPVDIGKRVLSRNIFDPETGSIPWVPPPPPVDTVVDDSDPDAPALPTGEPDVCEGSARLVAAMVVPRTPEHSFASIEEGGQAMLYRTGMRVGDMQLVGIREQRVFLQPSAKPLCQLVMFRPENAPSAPAQQPEPETEKPQRPSRPSRNGGLTKEEMDAGITKNSDTSYTVTRELIDKALGNQAELMRSARIIPYEESGRTVGVKIYGIRRNSLLGRLGVQNGDVLRTINGFDMTSPDSALEAYTRLRSADNISLSMMRRGKPSSLEYTIR